MSFFLVLTVALMAGAAALIAKRRSQRGPSRSGRYRSPRAGLNLERPAGLPSRSRRATAPSAKSLAGPIFLALVVVVMVFWVVAAFILPGGETRAAMVSETRLDASPPEQFTSLAGRLSSEPGYSAAGNAMAQAAAQTSIPPLPPSASADQATAAGSSLMAAAQSMAPAGDSRLAQVGLIPSQVRSKPQSTAGSSAPRPAPANTDSQARAAQASATQSNRIPSASQNVAPAAGQAAPIVPVASSPPPGAGTAVARSSVVSATSASSAPRAAAGGGLASANTPRSGSSGRGSELSPPDEAVLASSRSFTVHLASFTDQGNAEKYVSKLAEADESAFISQVKMEGRLWFRVMSGRFNTRAAAEAHGKDLKRRSLTAETGNYLIKPLD